MNLRRGQVSTYSVFIFMAILIVIAPQYIYITSSVNMVNALAVLTVLTYAVAIRKTYRPTISFDVLLIWLFYVVYCIQCLLTVSIFKFITYSIIMLVLPYLIYSLINTKNIFFRTIDMMICAGTWLGVYGIVEEILQFNFLQQFVQGDVTVFHEIRYGLLRIMGTFGQPIGYGLFHVFLVTLILYRMNTHEKNPLSLKISYITCILNVVFSVSRIPIMALILIHLLLLTKISRRKAVNYTVFGIIALFIIVMIFGIFNIQIPLIDDLIQTITWIADGADDATKSSTVGVGSRFDLWKWVTVSMGDKWVTGHGLSAQFSYKVYDWATKESIENQYLNTLYYSGLIGLIPLVISYIGVIRTTLKKGNRFSEEANFSFNDISFFLMIIYYVCQFGTQESDMTRMYLFYLVLILAYNKLSVEKDFSGVIQSLRRVSDVGKKVKNSQYILLDW